jgi:hypothetical protein
MVEEAKEAVAQAEALSKKVAAPKAAALIQINEEPAAVDPTPPATDAAAQAAAAPEKPAGEQAEVTQTKKIL